jgi:pimeloyl-ACP methyl ester carboxylesterase
MQTLRVNGYDMAYLALGQGMPLVCVHGTLGDFRSWNAVLGPLSQAYRVIAVSLRRFFPEHWDGSGDDYRIAQHVDDVIGFIEQISPQPVNLMGHSRGAHIAFRVAQRRPDLLHRLILVEPGGSLDTTLDPEARPTSGPAARMKIYAEQIKSGDIDSALQDFVDLIDGEGAWARLSEPARQQMRDNAFTLTAQAHEGRKPFSRPDAEAIRTPTLFIGGTETRGGLAANHRALAQYVAGARTAMIPHARHWMFDSAPQAYCKIVLDFLGTEARSFASNSLRRSSKRVER